MSRETTVSALRRALLTLLRSRPLDKLTVGEVARAAGVSRVTFYQYFRGVYDLAGEACVHETGRAMGGTPSPENWEGCLLRLMRAMRENRWLIGKLRLSDGWPQIERQLREASFQKVMDFIQSLPDGGASAGDRAFAARFYGLALTGFILDWAAEGMKEDPEEIVRRLKVILTGQLESALGSFGAAAKEELQC